MRLEPGLNSILGKKVFFLPSNVQCTGLKPRLLVMLSTHNQGDKFFCLGRLRNLSLRPFDTVFLTDPKNTYYLESDSGLLYSKLISDISFGYAPEDVTVFGSSMSGYAALLYGRSNDFNIIVNNPQLDVLGSYDYAWSNLKKTIDSLESSPPLIKDVFLKNDSSGAVMLVHGKHPMDMYNCVDSFSFKSSIDTLLYKSREEVDHGFYFSDESSIKLSVELLLFARDGLNINNLNIGVREDIVV